MKENNTPAPAAAALCDVATEKAVIGHLISYPDDYADNANDMDADLFTDERCRTMWDAITAIIERGDVPDIVMIGIELQKNNKYDLVPVVAEYVAEASDVGNFPRYLLRLQDFATRRTLSRIAKAMDAEARRPDADPAQIASKYYELIKQLQESDKDAMLDAQGALEQLDAVVKANMTGESVSGVTTGFASWDNLGGLHFSDLTIIAAYPSAGKTSLALSIMYKVAQSGTPVAMFSAEMPSYQIAAKLLSPISGIPASDLMFHPLTADGLQKYDEAVGKLCNLPFYVDDTSRASLTHIASTIRALSRKRGVRLFFIDYLQLLHFPRTDKPEHAVLADAAKSLKSLAKELSVCIVLLSQLSREGADRTPKLSKLRGSGEIEEAADVVALLHHPNATVGERYEGADANIDPERTAKIIIAKGRNVGRSSFFVGFNPLTTHFYDTDTLPMLAASSPTTNEDLINMF